MGLGSSFATCDHEVGACKISDLQRTNVQKVVQAKSTNDQLMGEQQGMAKAKTPRNKPGFIKMFQDGYAYISGKGVKKLKSLNKAE